MPSPQRHAAQVPLSVTRIGICRSDSKTATWPSCNHCVSAQPRKNEKSRRRFAPTPAFDFQAVENDRLELGSLFIVY
jgi:hypothetical protein